MSLSTFKDGHIVEDNMLAISYDEESPDKACVTHYYHESGMTHTNCRGMYIESATNEGLSANEKAWISGISER